MNKFRGYLLKVCSNSKWGLVPYLLEFNWPSSLIKIETPCRLVARAIGLRLKAHAKENISFTRKVQNIKITTYISRQGSLSICLIKRDVISRASQIATYTFSDINPVWPKNQKLLFKCTSKRVNFV